MTNELTSILVEPPRTSPRPGPGPLRLPALAVAALACYLAPRALVGADTMWMVALGDRIVTEGSVPDGVPFAAADSAGWPNVPVLGELTMWAIHTPGPSALAVALVTIGMASLLLLAQGAQRAGARPLAVATAVGLAGVGMLPALGVVRAQMLSLVPFTLLVLLLRSESRRPSERIWLVVPLVAIWGNLHGAVLVGVALIGCHLVFARLRTTPVTAVLVGLATLAAVFANPALLRTGHYYLGVLSNEAARRGTELWARPDLTSTFDLLMVLAALVLGATALLRGRLRLWEVVAVVGMGAATVTSARHGMWLLLFLVGPGAVGLSRLLDHRAEKASDRRPRMTQVLAPALAIGLTAVAAATLVARGPELEGPVDAVRAVGAVAGTRVVLAPEPLAEDLAAAGITVWVSNPIDAFRPEDQGAYLDVWKGHDAGRRAIEAAGVVVAKPGSPAHRLAVDTGCADLTRVSGFSILECGR